MDRQAIAEELKAIIGDYLGAQGLDLVDLIYRYEGSDLVVRVLTDRPEGGIRLDECAQINNQISQILDEKDFLEARYTLEVSSPGLDRPLKIKSDFARCMNKAARFFLNQQINGKLELAGVIRQVKEEAVFIEIDAETIEVGFSKINKATQILEGI